MRVEFRIFKPVEDFEIFVTGFHGIGLVGYIATRYLARGCEVVGRIRYRGEPPVISAEGERLVLQNEIFSCGRVVGALNNFGIDERAMYDYTKALARWVVSNGFRLAVLFGGLDSRFRRGPNESLRILHTSAYGRAGLPTGGLPRLEQGLQVVGPLALLTSFLEELDFPALVILPYADVSRPADPYAASVALEAFSRLFGIEVDVGGLRHMAEELERELEEARRRMEARREESKLYI